VSQVIRGSEGLIAILVALSLVALAACLIYIYWTIHTHKLIADALRRVSRVLCCLSMFEVLALILQPSSFDETRLNLIPGRDLFASTDIQTALVNLIGNVAMFIPFGFFGPECSTRLRKPASLLILGLGISSSAEMVQYIFHLGRSADVTDVLLNTVGVLLGGLLNWIIVRPVSARLVRLQE